MPSASLAYDCLLVLSGAALQAYSMRYFLESSRSIRTKGKSVRDVWNCDMCEISREECISKYPQAVDMCMRICYNDSSRREDDIALEILKKLVSKARKNIMFETPITPCKPYLFG